MVASATVEVEPLLSLVAVLAKQSGRSRDTSCPKWRPVVGIKKPRLVCRIKLLWIWMMWLHWRDSYSVDPSQMRWIALCHCNHGNTHDTVAITTQRWHWHGHWQGLHKIELKCKERIGWWFAMAKSILQSLTTLTLSCFPHEINQGFLHFIMQNMLHISKD